MKPYFDFHIFCCLNERKEGDPRGCCGAERGDMIRNRLSKMLRKHGLTRSRANKSHCLDRCEFGPCIVVYPEGVWYRIEDVDEDCEEIVREHLVGGRVVARLQLPPRESEVSEATSSETKARP